MEPFVGGGAMFFYLSSTRPSLSAFISDNNTELINCYIQVRDNVEQVIPELLTHRKMHSELHYYDVRATDPTSLGHIERAARFIYLNKTCFNGLYRVNRRGQFNVPIGRYANPQICDQDNLRKCSAALSGVTIANTSFELAVKDAKSGDFVYFDPPYQPLSATASFTSYTSDGFDRSQQQALKNTFCELVTRGCYVLLSNSDCGFTRELYNGSSGELVVPITAARAINCKASGRGRVGEILVVGHPSGNSEISR